MSAHAEGGWLERQFKMSQRGTNIRTELMGGLTTFMVMSYIIAVNPSILNLGGGGLDVLDAHGYRPGGREGLDRSMVAVFEYGNGAVGTLLHSWEIGSPLRGLRLSSVYGTSGAITSGRASRLQTRVSERQRRRTPKTNGCCVRSTSTGARRRLRTISWR